MRLSLALVVAACIAGCGTSDNGSDMGGDLAVSMDMTAGVDMTMVKPFNMAGSVYCYGTLLCATSSPSMKVCCDNRADGGFSDTCVANANACPGGKTFACGQAADCPASQVCCGDIGTSSSGKKFFNDTVCAASCGSSQTQLCVTAAECKSGTTCVGQSITGRDVGLCM